MADNVTATRCVQLPQLDRPRATACVALLFLGESGASVRVGLFFFSSRRRHTRLSCDWSSDVCSSDLMYGDHRDYRVTGVQTCALPIEEHTSELQSHDNLVCLEFRRVLFRSEERKPELQSHDNLVCRLLLEKKKITLPQSSRRLTQTPAHRRRPHPHPA